MDGPLPFDSRPDPVLGAELRAALDGDDGVAFLSVLRHRLAEATAAESPWEVLARWAPRGLIAAAAAAAILFFLVRPAADPGPAQSLAVVPTELEIAPGQSEAQLLSVALVEGR
jgi:hypothetical protein